MEAGVATSLDIATRSLLPIPSAMGVFSMAIARSHGALRRADDPSTKRIINATDDIQAIWSWLENHSASPLTYRSYEKEVVRLVMWAAIHRGKPVSSLMADDFVAYQAFLKDPPAAWCVGHHEVIGRDGEKRMVPDRPRRRDPAWRPFQGPMGLKGIRQALIIIKSMLEWLTAANYLSANPLAIVRIHRTKEAKAAMRRSVRDRHLDRPTLNFVLETLDGRPRETPRAVAHYERRRFLWVLLYQLAARRAEVASLTTSSFYYSDGRLWINLVGKGDPVGEGLPVSNELKDAIRRYRTFLKKTPLPKVSKNEAVLFNITGRAGIESHDTIYRETKEIFAMAADRAREEGRDDLARNLYQASTHWLRHSRITHLSDDKVDLKKIKRLARHQSIETTALYMNTDDKEFHDEINEHSTEWPQA